MRNEYVVVICRNKDGTPTAPVYMVEVTDEQYDLGYHYDMAMDKALDDGYENTALSHCFDNSEHDEIIRTAFFLEELKETGLVD